jgi:nicotinamidase-related amidase
MSDKTYDPADTALLVVDPYNDFMSEGGKLYDQIKDVADSVDMFGNLRKLIPAARSAGLKIFVLPHRSYQEGDYENWRQRTVPGDGYGEQGFRARHLGRGIPPGIRPPEG